MLVIFGSPAAGMPWRWAAGRFRGELPGPAFNAMMGGWR
jgi:hypothetical protein